MPTHQKKIGTILWQDLTVKNAEKVKDFYQHVVGWDTSPVSMGDYNDYSVVTPNSKETVGGICHAKGANEHIPAQWLLYVQVEDVKESIARCVSLGGKLVDGPRSMNDHQFCVIQDPEGAVIALMSPE